MNAAEEQSGAVAHEYARALLDLALAGDASEAVLTELAALVQMARELPELEEFLASPLVDVGQKLAALGKAVEGRLSVLTADFLAVLIRNGRGRLLPAVHREYRRLLNERLGRIDVQVVSATELDEPVRCELAAMLRDDLRAEPLLDVRVDPELLGGLSVRVGDRVIDASVRAHLRQLRTALAASRKT